MQAFETLTQGVVLTPNEVALFYVLLHSWNTARRPAVFEQWAETTCGRSGLTKHTLPVARNKLIQRGVITFTKSGRRGIPQYSFTPLLLPDSGNRIGIRAGIRAGIGSDSYQEKEKEKEKDSSPQAEEKEILSELWNQSPKMARQRSSKKQVIAAWRKIPKAERPNKEDLIKAINTWIRCDEWTREGGQYVQGLHLWIKAQKWEDLPDLPQPEQDTGRAYGKILTPDML